MVVFTAQILKVNQKGGWSYIVIDKKYAQRLQPETRTSFRVKGTLDDHPIQKTALLPLRNGNFMLPVNASMRRATGKQAGDKLKISIEPDARRHPLSKDLLACLKDDAEAMRFFKSLSLSHRQYFSQWIEDAKTPRTKTKRLVTCLMACNRKMNFQETLELYKTADPA